MLSNAVSANNTLLVLGDSLSAGYGINQKEGWVSLLQTRLKKKRKPYQVINASITGETTYGGLNRLEKLLYLHNPSILILELGGNDGLRGFDLDTTYKNLQKIIHLSKKKNIKILMLGVRLPPNYGEKYTLQFQSIFKTLASEENILLIPAFMLGVAENKNLMQSDGIHPNKKAQIKLLENIWPALKSML